MSNRRCLVQGGVVVNVVEVDDGWEMPEEYTEAPGDGEIGWAWDGAHFTPPAVEAPPPRPPKPIEEVRADVMAQIDTDAERIRMQYLTAGVGQSLVYSQKLEEAKLVMEMTEAEAVAIPIAQVEVEYPILSASIGTEASDLYSAAELVMSRYVQFASVGRQIEKERLRAKVSVSAAPTEDAVYAAYGAVNWPMKR